MRSASASFASASFASTLAGEDAGSLEALGVAATACLFACGVPALAGLLQERWEVPGRGEVERGAVERGALHAELLHAACSRVGGVLSATALAPPPAPRRVPAKWGYR